jgi:signal recognition particle subunit SEC65
MKKMMATTVFAALAAAMAVPAMAEGNLASRATELELDINTVDLNFSQPQFEIETGKYYILHVTSDGAEEIQVVAPELWRNSWINQVVVNDLETTPYGLYGIEFDDEGTFSIGFVPIRPGEYDIYVPGYEERGLSGKFVVK